MNRVPASVFLLCIVKLQEFCYKYGYSDYRVLADLLLDACVVDGSGKKDSFPHTLDEIRNSEPFKDLSLTEETFVYATFKQLR